jgi:Reverse transcriptase (RNA-dependent DNA polymerase)
VNWVLDADVRDFFNQLDHSWLERFLEHRIADKRILRLIQKWLSAGAIEDGQWSENVEGTPQGASVSPLLANVYLHYVFDLWAQWWRTRFAEGDVVIVRFADDFTVGFEYQEDAQRFWADLAGTVREVRAGTTSRQDPVDRVRAACRSATKGAGSGQAGDVRLPWFHAFFVEPPSADGSGCGASRSPNGCGPSYERSMTNSSGVGISPSRSKASGCAVW